MSRRAGIGTRLIGASLLAALALAVALPADALTARVVSNGSRSRPVVALTFDDGVSPQNCRRILAILVAQHVPATFFPIADAMGLDPGFWRLVAGAGYPVGDHTWSHPQLPKLDEAAQLAEIERGRTVAESILGRSVARVFRPPYGAYDADTIAAAGQAGFGTVLLWDTSARDTSVNGTVEQMLAAGERGTDGSVVLMHCGPNATPYLLADLIASYRSRGFGFVTIPELLGVAWAAGPTSPVSPATILGGLSPLPPSPKGGALTGPSGYQGPTPSATPRPTVRASPSPSPSASPSPTPSASPPPSPSPSPSSSDSLSPSASPATPASPAAASPPSGPADRHDASAADTSYMATIGVLGLSLLGLASVALGIRRARPGGGPGPAGDPGPTGAPDR